MAKEFKEEVLQVVGEVGDYHVRVVENARGKFLDVRQFITSSKSGYTGFTQKGVRVRADEFGRLLRLVAEAAAPLGEAELVQLLLSDLPEPQDAEVAKFMAKSASNDGFEFEF